MISIGPSSTSIQHVQKKCLPWAVSILIQALKVLVKYRSEKNPWYPIIMDITDIGPGLDQLSTSLDQLEADLKPLLGDLSTASSKLPLLDKAKLYVLAAYTLESLLFCISISAQTR